MGVLLGAIIAGVVAFVLMNDDDDDDTAVAAEPSASAAASPSASAAVSPAASPAGVSRSPDMTTLSGSGALIVALQVWRMPGLSWVGIQVRLSVGWPWLRR